ncbi:hypothetical protein SPWS13_1204 [Shewanella putrefaciens]|nr:hypothetical protein SPWS13_1204 [Shewanella putrefaciens]
MRLFILLFSFAHLTFNTLLLSIYKKPLKHHIDSAFLGVNVSISCTD